jgi:hypothetical protein
MASIGAGRSTLAESVTIIVVPPNTVDGFFGFAPVFATGAAQLPATTMDSGAV